MEVVEKVIPIPTQIVEKTVYVDRTQTIEKVVNQIVERTPIINKTFPTTIKETRIVEEFDDSSLLRRIKMNRNLISQLSRIDDTIYTADGILTGNREISLNSHSLSFSGLGNIGIGNINPVHKLDVTGTGRFTDDLTLDSSLNVAGATNLSSLNLSGIFYDSTAQAGTSGQVLITTGTSTL